MTRSPAGRPNSVATGLHVLLNEQLGRLSQRRVGLVTNPTGVTLDLRANIDVLRSAGVNLVALFGPEHGIAAAAPDAQHVASSDDRHTGLPIYSLYGETREPTQQMLANVDLLLFDLQDVGVRFYTYTATLALALAACAQNHIPLMVLDRPNPIGGRIVEGPMLERALQSFIGRGVLPIRYGLTLGELARFYNEELAIGVDLQVVTMQGWDREMWFDQTGFSWVPPSPGMPHLTTAVVYPGMCLVEGTNLSEGRGTALPFEIVGAPWIDGHALADELNGKSLPGVVFRPSTFAPCAARFAGQECGGVQVHVTDRSAFRPVLAGLHVLAACKRQAPDEFEILATSWEGQPAHLDLLAGTARVRQVLEAGQSVDALAAEWTSGLAAFEKIRARYMLY